MYVCIYVCNVCVYVFTYVYNLIMCVCSSKLIYVYIYMYIYLFIFGSWARGLVGFGPGQGINWTRVPAMQYINPTRSNLRRVGGLVYNI